MRALETTRRRFLAALAGTAGIAAGCSDQQRDVMSLPSAAKAIHPVLSDLPPQFEIPVTSSDLQRLLSGESSERRDHILWLLNGGCLQIRRADCSSGRGRGRAIARRRGQCFIHKRDHVLFGTLTESELPCAERNRVQVSEILSVGDELALGRYLQEHPHSLSRVFAGPVPLTVVLGIPSLNDRGPFRVETSLSPCGYNRWVMNVATEWLIQVVEFTTDPALMSAPSPDASMILDVQLPPSLSLPVLE